jgi:hypothetical protein
MERKHNLFFCTQCGYKLTGEEFICPGCGLKLAEPPVVAETVTPKTETPPITEPVKDIKPVPPVQQNIPPVKEPVKKDVKPVAPAPLIQPSYPEKTKTVKKKKGLGLVWLILIIVGGVIIIGGGTVAFLQYNGNIKIAFLEKYIPLKSLSQAPVTLNKTDSTKLSGTNTPAVGNNNNVQGNNNTVTDNTNNNTNNDANNENSQNNYHPNTSMKFFIIAGSYGTMQLAQQAVGELKSKGYSEAMVVGTNDQGGWRICYKAYATREEAGKDLGNIKQSENPSAWIFELN